MSSGKIELTPGAREIFRKYLREAQLNIMAKQQAERDVEMAQQELAKESQIDAAYKSLKNIIAQNQSDPNLSEKMDKWKTDLKTTLSRDNTEILGVKFTKSSITQLDEIYIAARLKLIPEIVAGNLPTSLEVYNPPQAKVEVAPLPKKTLTETPKLAEIEPILPKKGTKTLEVIPTADATKALKEEGAAAATPPEKKLTIVFEGSAEAAEIAKTHATSGQSTNAASWRLLGEITPEPLKTAPVGGYNYCYIPTNSSFTYLEQNALDELYKANFTFILPEGSNLHIEGPDSKGLYKLVFTEDLAPQTAAAAAAAEVFPEADGHIINTAVVDLSEFQTMSFTGVHHDAATADHFAPISGAAAWWIHN